MPYDPPRPAPEASATETLARASTPARLRRLGARGTLSETQGIRTHLEGPREDTALRGGLPSAGFPGLQPRSVAPGAA